MMDVSINGFNQINIIYMCLAQKNIHLLNITNPHYAMFIPCILEIFLFPLPSYLSYSLDD
jgi:hypothetical protein